MKPKDVYLKAAQLIASGEETFSCTAVGHVTGISINCPLRQKYADLFVPYPDGRINWLSPIHINEAADDILVDPKDLRVLMLCMMAAIVS